MYSANFRPERITVRFWYKDMSLVASRSVLLYLRMLCRIVDDL